jgi:cellulose biosynthesis protein BcsQ
VNRKQSRISALLDSVQNRQNNLIDFDKQRNAISLRGLDESDLGGANTRDVIRGGGLGTDKSSSENQIDVVLNGGKSMSGNIKCHCIW